MKIWLTEVPVCLFHRSSSVSTETFGDKNLIALTKSINPFVPNATFLYPLKISENLRVFGCFLGVEKGCIGNKWVNSCATL